jgi:hypothetical protein
MFPAITMPWRAVIYCSRMRELIAIGFVSPQKWFSEIPDNMLAAGSAWSRPLS